MISFRPATLEELLAHLQLDIKYGMRTQFRRFTSERPHARAKNGVSHHVYSKAQVHLVEGRPFVRYQRKLHELTASVMKLDNGKECIYDVRIKSEYLP